MLAGRNDVAFVSRFAQQMELYSDDNVTLNGAYGFRWREHFGFDQLDLIIRELEVNPASRRCVLAMWDATDKYDQGGHNEPHEEGDLKFAMKGGKDLPCNTHCYFRVIKGQLDLTVSNRSNDVVWGAYGANAVHFSVMQEYVASALKLTVGVMYQLSNNYHIYETRDDVRRLYGPGVELTADDRYDADTGRVKPTPVMTTDKKTWDVDCQNFILECNTKYTHNYEEPFFNLASRMVHAHDLYKGGNLDGAIKYMGELAIMYKFDWYQAGLEWLQRRAAKRALEVKP
jgi:hypothetical protein